MALSLCSKYGILWNCKIHLRESISELLPGKDVCGSSWAQHIFLMVDQKAVKGTGYSCNNTWAGLGHLLAEKPSSEKEKLCIWCCYCFQALFSFQEEEKLPAPHRNDCVVPKLKPENPTALLDANSAFTEANVRCKGAAVISRRRKRMHPLPSGGHPEHRVLSLRVTVGRIYLLLDDKATPKRPCSYLKHPNVWEIHSEARSCCFCFIFSFSGQNCWRSCISWYWKKKKISVFCYFLARQYSGIWWWK